MSLHVTLSGRHARRSVRAAVVASLVPLAVMVAVLPPGGDALAATTAPADEAPAEDAPADAGDAERAVFGIQPANASGGLDARALYQFNLPPESTVFDYVAVVNYGDVDLTLNTYATDAFSSETGDFALLSGDEPAIDAGSWISMGQPGDAGGEITVPAAGPDGPGATVLPVNITVPGNATPGDHAAGLLAVLSSLGTSAGGQNVQLEQRVAARVYVRIDGELAPGLRISEISQDYRAARLPWQSGQVDLSYRVTNTGNVRMGIEPSAVVEGPLGLNKQRGAAPPLPELLPGGSYVVEQQVDGVWPLVVLDTTIELVAVAAPGALPPELAPTTATARTWAVPWFLLIVVAVVVLILVFVLLRRRRRGTARQPDAPTGPPTPTPVGASAA